MGSVLRGLEEKIMKKTVEEALSKNITELLMEIRRLNDNLEKLANIFEKIMKIYEERVCHGKERQG